MPDRTFRLHRSACWKRVTLSMAALMLMASVASAQNTIPSWNGTNFISSFGVPNTATYGQTITVPTGASPLNSFSFEIGNCSAAVTFRGEVYAWDGAKATGPALFESATQSVPSSSTFQLVTFNAGGITLPAGTYVLFASTSRDQTAAPSSACRWGALTNNATYPGGQFVFMNNGPDPSLWTVNTWSNIAEDLAFSVDGLTPPAASSAEGAPAASTVSLLIGFAALAGLGLFRLSRHGHVV